MKTLSAISYQLHPFGCARGVSYQPERNRVFQRQFTILNIELHEILLYLRPGAFASLR